MNCFSTYLVGFATIALVLYDMIQNDWNNTLFHALGGILLTVLFGLLCYFIGDALALSVLVVPILVFLIFALGIWSTRESLRKRGCCVKCTGSDSIENAEASCDGKLKGTSLV
jgi:hypothetical protein